MYEKRTYRNWIENKDLVSFSVEIEQSDLFIRADKLLSAEALQCLRLLRRVIQDYIKDYPEFATTLKPYSVGRQAPEIIREMAAAAAKARVGPMAAVAGAIAEYVGRDLLRNSSEVIVENGGDIFMRTKRARKVAIFAGKSDFSGKLALEIAPSEDFWGICTSSGTVGPSLSFGRADAAVVICNCAILADAWATSLGNMVKSASDIENTIKFAKDKPEIKGVVIIAGDKIGVWGEIKLLKMKNAKFEI